MENYWSKNEYSKYKLLLHNEKVDSIMSVLKREQLFDTIYPLSVDLQLTDFCNLKCEWCTDKNLHYNPSIMEYEIACKLIDEFSEKGIGITIEGGGEPTIHNRFEDIANYGHRHGASMGLITNGTYDLSGVLNCFKWIRISLDASTREEYIIEKKIDKFQVVMNNIKNYKSIRNVHDTYLGIGYVITNRNYKHIDDLVIQLDQLGIDYIYLRPVEEAEKLIPDKNKLYQLKQRLGEVTKGLRIKYKIIIDERYEIANANLPCIAHSLTSIIHANGDVICCEKRRHDIKILGNIKEKSFYDIWTSKYRQEVTQFLLNPTGQVECSVCRMTGFNHIFNNLNHVNTIDFI